MNYIGENEKTRFSPRSRGVRSDTSISHISSMNRCNNGLKRIVCAAAQADLSIC